MKNKRFTAKILIDIAFIGYYSGVFLKKTGKRKRKGSY